jgi:hypothetical protein
LVVGLAQKCKITTHQLKQKLEGLNNMRCKLMRLLKTIRSSKNACSQRLPAQPRSLFRSSYSIQQQKCVAPAHSTNQRADSGALIKQ